MGGKSTSSGSIVGIVIGIIAVALAAAVVFTIVYRNRKARDKKYAEIRAKQEARDAFLNEHHTSADTNRYSSEMARARRRA